MAADIDNINVNSPDAIERERYLLQVRQDLQNQFEEIDADHNGYVDKDELIQYMLRLTGNNEEMSVEQEYDLRGRFEEVVTGLFERMDKSGDQRVDVQEFIDVFHYEFVTLTEEIEELEMRIHDQELRAKQVEKRIIDQRKAEKYTNAMHPAFPNQRIMKQSILSVHLIDARELRPVFGPVPNAQVKAMIEGSRDSTKDAV